MKRLLRAWRDELSALPPEQRHCNGIPYTLIRRRRRTIALQVRADGSIEVRAPLRCALHQIEPFLLSKRDWIVRRRSEIDAVRAGMRTLCFAAGETLPWLGGEYPLRVADKQRAALCLDAAGFSLHPGWQDRGVEALARFYRRAGLEWIVPRVEQYAAALGVPRPQVRVMDLRGHWGSCILHRGRTPRVNFNTRLFMAPPEIVDYVAAHECAHLRHPSHAPVFWHTVEDLCPAYVAHRDWLKRHGPRLMY